MRGGTLAVSSGDMHAFKFFMRIVKAFAKLKRVGQVFLKSGSTVPGKHRELTIEVVEGLLVVNFSVGSFQLAVGN